MSHGASGIAMALLALYGHTGKSRFRQAAEAALIYERAMFVPAVGNWQDLRPDAHEPAITWCHGAAGIGLARAAMLRHSTDPTINDDLEVAVATTATSSVGSCHCLCHGDAGNLELLLHASSRAGNDWLHAVIDRRAANLVADVSSRQWRCGNLNDIETPGLMTGVAGIGYELLRLARPQQVPCVLTLDPPADQR
jgi:lantibiotic modifying enzyme